MWLLSGGYGRREESFKVVSLSGVQRFKDHTSKWGGEKGKEGFRIFLAKNERKKKKKKKKCEQQPQTSNRVSGSMREMARRCRAEAIPLGERRTPRRRTEGCDWRELSPTETNGIEVTVSHFFGL